MSHQQQETTTMPDKTTDTDPLDYLSINRARWDEWAPHVSETLSKKKNVAV
jgi:CRISPR/Cas system CMR-associated protein Cmr5 small subunit